MIWQQRLAALAFGLVGLYGMWGGTQIGLWRFGRPWAGLWPFLVSATMVVLAVVVWIGAGKNAPKPGDGSEKVGNGSRDTGETGLRDLIVTIAGGLAFSLFIRTVGFLAGGLLLLLLLFRVVGRERWFTTISVSAGAIIVFYLIFAVLLSIPLPRGIVAWIF